MALALRGTALQLRHAAQLLLKDAKGSKGGKSGVPELQLVADNDQAMWISGKSGGTLRRLQQEHAGVEISIRRPHGGRDRLIILCLDRHITQRLRKDHAELLRRSASHIPEAVHAIAELWLGQGIVPPRGAAGGGGGSASGSSSGAAGGSSSSSAGASSSAATWRDEMLDAPLEPAGKAAAPSEVRVRSFEDVMAEKRRKQAAASGSTASGSTPPFTPGPPQQLLTPSKSSEAPATPAVPAAVDQEGKCREQRPRLKEERRQREAAAEVAAAAPASAAQSQQPSAQPHSSERVEKVPMRKQSRWSDAKVRESVVQAAPAPPPPPPQTAAISNQLAAAEVHNRPFVDRTLQRAQPDELCETLEVGLDPVAGCQVRGGKPCSS